MDTKASRILLGPALGIAIVAVSTASILIRFAQREAPSLTIAAMRLTIASLLLAPLAIARYRADLKSISRRQVALGMASGFFLAIHFASWISSLEYTTVTSSVVLVSTGPLWVALVSPFFLNERLARAALLGLLLAIVGGALIGVAGSCWWDSGIRCGALDQAIHGRAMWGNLLALVGAWAVTGYLVIGRQLRSALSLVPYILIAYGSAAVFLLLVMLMLGQSPFGLSPITYLWIVLLAVVPQLIGHSTYNWALRFLPAALVAIATLGEPIGSAILAYVVLHEQPGLLVLCGGALILVGIYLASKRAGTAESNPS
jgi:drug/metabolite transporter (DMT)-like permease